MEEQWVQTDPVSSCFFFSSSYSWALMLEKYCVIVIVIVIVSWALLMQGEIYLVLSNGQCLLWSVILDYCVQCVKGDFIFAIVVVILDTGVLKFVAP